MIAAYIVTLMHQHNHSKYMKWMKRMNKLGLFCCCKSLINDVLKNEQDKKARRASQTQQTHTKTEVVMSQVIAK